ncbi:MAG: 50S ribosomal protein L22 [Candidatus Dojkabacteria bacterium]|jgi:large subunit ribosomal protein L22
MEEKTVKVKIKNIAQSPLKLRLVADTVRGKSVDEALTILPMIRRKGVKTIEKAIMSGVANAREMYGANQDDLVIDKIMINEAPMFKRTKFRAKGRVSIIFRRRSHINLELKVK